MDEKDIVCLDVETTGIDRDELEILQLSMVRGDGQVLMNEYFKPERHDEWPKAMAIHGITPEGVKDKKPFSSYRDQINDLLRDKKLITGYNCDYFDIPVLQKNGIQFPGNAQTGPMSRKRTLILESRQILPILRKISSASSLDSGAHYPLDPFLLPSSKESISDSSWLKAHQSTRG